VAVKVVVLPDFGLKVPRKGESTVHCGEISTLLEVSLLHTAV
jgi:hypothetical protein